MLLQRAFCRNWQRQIIKPAERSKSRLTTLLLHHHRHGPAVSSRQYMLLRAFRTSSRYLKTARTNSLNQTPVTPPPFENLSLGGPVPPGNVFKALVFAGAFSIGSFMGATILEYENTRNMMMEKARQSKIAWLQRKKSFGSEHADMWQNIKREFNKYWDQLSPGERVFAPLCALNLIVFGLWRIPAMRQTMMTYFCSNPAGRAVCWPMFLSTFSHYSMFHIFANMYVLHSFSNAAVLSLGKEQFLGVYLSAGVIASLSSILYKTAASQAGLSIGASGAIMAILAYVCSKYPDTQLNILFLPMLTFSAGAAIKVIIGVDIAGCILGWKFFDHAAHLGGAVFGVFWAYLGTEMWQKRIPFLTMYHDFRKTK